MDIIVLLFYLGILFDLIAVNLCIMEICDREIEL